MFFKKLLIVLLFLLIIFGFSYGVVWFYENAAMEKSAEQSQTNDEPVAEQVVEEPNDRKVLSYLKEFMPDKGTVKVTDNFSILNCKYEDGVWTEKIEMSSRAYSGIEYLCNERNLSKLVPAFFYKKQLKEHWTKLSQLNVCLKLELQTSYYLDRPSIVCELTNAELRKLVDSEEYRDFAKFKMRTESKNENIKIDHDYYKKVPIGLSISKQSGVFIEDNNYVVEIFYDKSTYNRMKRKESSRNAEVNKQYRELGWYEYLNMCRFKMNYIVRMTHWGENPDTTENVIVYSDLVELDYLDYK